MRFLFCLSRYHTNAVPWVRILAAAGHQINVHVVARGATESYEQLEPVFFEPCRLSRIMMRHIKSTAPNNPLSFPHPAHYWALMRRLDPEVVIVRDVTPWISRIAILCALGQGRRVVVYDQNDPVPPLFHRTWYRRAGLRLLGIPHITVRLPAIGTTPHGLGRAVPLPFGSAFTPDRVHALGSRPLSWPPRILMIGKYRSRKGHAQLLEALAAIAHRVEASLTLCGEEKDAADTAFVSSLLQRAASLGLAGRVRIHNNVPHNAIAELYAMHDLFVLPSVKEPAAVSPIEAAFAGCLVMTTRGGGTRHYLPPGPSFEFAPDDAQDLARALESALASPERLMTLRDQCRAHVEAVAGDRRVLESFEGLAR